MDGHTTTYLDRGDVIPEWGVPLGDNHGFEVAEFYPQADQRYDVLVRAVLAPPPLEADTDAPSMPDGLLQPLIDRTLAFLWGSQGNAAMKAAAMADYEAGLQQLRKRRGDLRPKNKPWSRSVAKAPRRSGRQPYILPDEDVV